MYGVLGRLLLMLLGIALAACAAQTPTPPAPSAPDFAHTSSAGQTLTPPPTSTAPPTVNHTTTPPTTPPPTPTSIPPMQAEAAPTANELKLLGISFSPLPDSPQGISKDQAIETVLTHQFERPQLAGAQRLPRIYKSVGAQYGIASLLRTLRV